MRVEVPVRGGILRYGVLGHKACKLGRLPRGGDEPETKTYDRWRSVWGADVAMREEKAAPIVATILEKIIIFSNLTVATGWFRCF
jgi:hypothetical protein